jgi:hypothetical protein
LACELENQLKKADACLTHDFHFCSQNQTQSFKAFPHLAMPCQCLFPSLCVHYLYGQAKQLAAHLVEDSRLTDTFSTAFYYLSLIGVRAGESAKKKPMPV